MGGRGGEVRAAVSGWGGEVRYPVGCWGGEVRYSMGGRGRPSLRDTYYTSVVQETGQQTCLLE